MHLVVVCILYRRKWKKSRTEKEKKRKKLCSVIEFYKKWKCVNNFKEGKEGSHRTIVLYPFAIHFSLPYIVSNICRQPPCIFDRLLYPYIRLNSKYNAKLFSFFFDCASCVWKLKALLFVISDGLAVGDWTLHEIDTGCPKWQRQVPSLSMCIFVYPSSFTHIYSFSWLKSDKQKFSTYHTNHPAMIWN